MTDGPDSARVAADPHPRLRGFRLTDLSAVLGAVVWLGVSALTDYALVELFVALALLVFVPLGLGLAATPLRSGAIPRAYRLATVGQFPAACLATLSLSRPVGDALGVALAVPWVGVTVAIALFGLRRLLPRGLRPLSELSVDAALLYIPVGAVALVLHRAGVSFHFQPIIILLTVIHYHYAGFVLPLVTGLVGRTLADDSGRLRGSLPARTLRVVTPVIVANLALIAVGITFSPAVEVVAVSLFTVAVAGFALAVLGGVVPKVSRSRGLLLGVAALSLVWTMALALAYGYSAYPGTPDLLDIGDMVVRHGTVNALGFSLSALLAFRLSTPEATTPPPAPTVSRLAARGRVGVDFLGRRGLCSGDASGMMADFDRLAGSAFDPASVHPAVRTFYEDSANTRMAIRPDWRRPLGPLLPIYDRLAGTVDQLHLPTSAVEGDAELTSETCSVDDDADGRADVSAWVRAYPDGDAMYVATYAVTDLGDCSYLNAAFPLPGGTLTGILRPESMAGDADAGAGLHLTTQDPTGDGGLYLTVRGYPIRLPLDEQLHVWPVAEGRDSPFDAARTTDGDLFATHEITLLGTRLVTLHYRISP